MVAPPPARQTSAANAPTVPAASVAVAAVGVVVVGGVAVEKAAAGLARRVGLLPARSALPASDGPGAIRW